MRRIIAVISFPILLAACGAEPVWAPDEAVAAAAYRPAAEPPSITLFTMVNNRSDEGAHSGLMINASQRVVFDPAGTWWHRTVPERNDVHYGITPLMEQFYLDYHARETYRVVAQTVVVSPEVAERALQLVQARGAVPKAFCANSVSATLRELPGFEGVGRSFFPGKIMDRFAEVEGVEAVTYFDSDPHDHAAKLTSGQKSTNLYQVPGYAPKP